METQRKTYHAPLVLRMAGVLLEQDLLGRSNIDALLSTFEIVGHDIGGYYVYDEVNETWSTNEVPWD